VDACLGDETPASDALPHRSGTVYVPAPVRSRGGGLSFYGKEPRAVGGVDGG